MEEKIPYFVKKIAHFLSLSTEYLKTRRINSTTRRETKEDFDKEQNMTLPRLVIKKFAITIAFTFINVLKYIKHFRRLAIRILLQAKLLEDIFVWLTTFLSCVKPRNVEI